MSDVWMRKVREREKRVKDVPFSHLLFLDAINSTPDRNRWSIYPTCRSLSKWKEKQKTSTQSIARVDLTVNRNFSRFHVKMHCAFLLMNEKLSWSFKRSRRMTHWRRKRFDRMFEVIIVLFHTNIDTRERNCTIC